MGHQPHPPCNLTKPPNLHTHLAHLLLLQLELLLLLLVPRQLEEEAEDGLEVALVHVARAHLLHRHATPGQEGQRLLQVVQHLEIKSDLRKRHYRVVQLDFTPEIEVFYMPFERRRE